MNRNQKLTKRALEKLYVKEGLSTTEVAKRLGASDAGVYSALKRYRIPTRGQKEAARKRWGHTQKRNWKPFVKRYMRGSPLEEIAEEVGCAPSTASEHLRANGAKIRVRGAETNRPNSRNTIQFDVRRAIKMNKEGATLTEIGKVLGEEIGRPISVQLISRRFKKMGYKPLVHKASKDRFKNLQVSKRKVAREINATKCVICSETRGVQICHIKPRREGGELIAYNTLALCSTHHWCFDRGLLTEEESKNLKPHLLAAKRKGYTHSIYKV